MLEMGHGYQLGQNMILPCHLYGFLEDFIEGRIILKEIHVHEFVEKGF